MLLYAKHWEAQFRDIEMKIRHYSEMDSAIKKIILTRETT